MRPKYLKNIKTGLKFKWTEELEERGDLTPLYEEEAEQEAEQEGEFKCEICRKAFKSEKALKMHMVTAHKENKESK